MAEMFSELIASIVITVVMGVMIGPLIRFFTKGSLPRAPKPMSADIWHEIIARGTAGRWLGHLERFFYLAAFWMEAPILIAGWLAFKVASGWQNWNMIVKLPGELQGVDEMEYLRARSQLGSWIFHRFLIGTLLNILISLIAVMLSKILIYLAIGATYTHADLPDVGIHKDGGKLAPAMRSVGLRRHHD